MAAAGEPPEEVPSSITPCWRALRAYAGITPGPAATTPGGWLHLLAERTCGGQRRLFCGQRQPPSGGCCARKGCEPHVDSLSFVNMGLRKRQPPPEVNPRRKQARGMESPAALRSDAWPRYATPKGDMCRHENLRRRFHLQ